MLTVWDIEAKLDYLAKERLKIAVMDNVSATQVEYDAHLGRLQEAYNIELRKAKQREKSNGNTL